MNKKNKATPFKRLLAYALQDRRLVRQALLLLLIATILDVCGPILVKVFLDDYVVPGHWPQGEIIALTIAYLLLMCGTAIATYVQSIKLNIIAQDAVRSIREQVFDKVIHQPLREFDKSHTGNLISRITNDSEAIKQLYVEVLATFAQNLIRIIGILIAMAILNPQLMLICLLFVPIVAALMFIYQRYSAPLFHHARSLLSDINARLHESIQGMTVIQLNTQEKRFRKQFNETAEAHYRARLRNTKLDAFILRPLVDFLHKLMLAGLILVFGYQALNSPVEIGVLYAFIAYLGRFAEPLIEMTQRLNLYQQALVAGERIFELIDREDIPREINASAHVTRGHVQFKHIHFSYDGQHPVINNVSLTIPAGSFQAIVGHTGSGKSTLTQLLLRFYEPQYGSIEIDNYPLNQFEERTLRQQIAIVQQDPFIFNNSIRDNITLDLDLDDETVITAAQQTGLHQHVEKLDQGYATRLGERGAAFSSGQRQLLALTRALVRQPKILILDEATANIDSHSEAEIQKSLMSLRGEVTLLAIAHRLSTVEHADNITVLHHGHIAQQGTHPQLIKQPGIYKQLYEMQTLSKTSLLES